MYTSPMSANCRNLYVIYVKLEVGYFDVMFLTLPPSGKIRVVKRASTIKSSAQRSLSDINCVGSCAQAKKVLKSGIQSIGKPRGNIVPYIGIY